MLDINKSKCIIDPFNILIELRNKFDARYKYVLLLLKPYFLQIPNISRMYILQV